MLRSASIPCRDPAKADRTSVRLSVTHPRLFELLFKGMKPTFRFFPRQAHKAMKSAMPGTDRPILEDPDFWKFMLEDQREALNQGSRGVAVDAKIHYVDWGFRLAEIPGRVHVFHGTEDPMVPFAYGEHLAANIPGAELHVMEGQGHLFPVTYQKMIFELAEAEFSAA